MRKSAVAVGILAIAFAVAPSAAGRDRIGPHLRYYGQIFSVSPSSGSVRRIGPRDVSPLDPVWSPDGELIADYFYAGDPARTKIEVLTKDGRLLRRFDAGGDAPTGFAFSPDSRRLAFLRTYWNEKREADDAKLVTVPVAGGAPTVLADLAVGRPVWTPDGKSLLYRHGDISGTFVNGHDVAVDDGAIWSVGADGAGAHQLVPGDSQPPLLSPNGERFLYTHYTRDASEIWTARTDGTDARRLRTTRNTAAHGWATGDPAVWLLINGRKHSHGVLFDLAGKRHRLPSAIRSGPLAYSPDGDLIAWVDSHRVKTIRPDGTGSRLLFRFRTGWPHWPSCDEVSWRPDGKSFMMVCHQDSFD